MIRVFSAYINEFTSDDVEKESDLLDTVTRIRAERMRQEARLSTLVGRILLRRGIREIFSRYDYEITYNENGKPELDFCFFSISHSGDMAVCAISDAPVGVDIERIREIRRAGHYPLFTSDETKQINGADDPSERFLRLWTRKEAYVKMNGGAMSRDGGIDIEKAQDVVFNTEIRGNYMISTCLSVLGKQ